MNLVRIYPTVSTYQVTISVGLREEYSDKLHDISTVLKICQEYVDSVGLCVTVTPTTFVYTNGSEPGALIGLINYPRFPELSDVINGHAYALAERLLFELNQHRVTIIMPGKTKTLERKDV